MRVFMEKYKGYYIYLEDNKKFTASNTIRGNNINCIATYLYCSIVFETMNISVDTLDDIKRIIDEIKKMKQNNILYLLLLPPPHTF